MTVTLEDHGTIYEIPRPVDDGPDWGDPENDVGEPPSWADEPDPEPPESAQAPRPRAPSSVSSVLDRMLADGPLVHEPTGIASLDELTGGGPVYGSRWYLLGAPDAGKTALLIQLGHHWASQGVTVGLLAIDEEPEDIVTRLAQRCGYPRTDLEHRSPPEVERIRGDIGSLSLHIYDSSWTIEESADDLSRRPSDGRRVLLIDSLQTVQCLADRSERELSEMSAVTARTRAIRAVATRYRMLTVSTGELARGAYRSGDPELQSSILASGKHSGAIEYAARVLLGLRSVRGEKDVIDVELAKNKHGPRDEHVYLRIDRPSQTLSEVAYEPAPAEHRAQAREDARAASRAENLEAVLGCLPSQPAWLSQQDLLKALASKGRSCSHHTLQSWITKLAKDGRVIDLGDGARAKPHRYSRP